MAIVNHPPWNVYQYGKSWAYFFEANVWTFKRPDCKKLNRVSVVADEETANSGV